MSRLVHHVTAARFGDGTRLQDSTLTVDPDELKACFDSPALADVRLDWASPGDSVRLVKVLDAVEPRTRDAEAGGPFPGWIGPARGEGGGDVHVLRGVAVVVAGYVPRAQEAVLDMSGPGATLSPLGSTHNLVVEFTPTDGADWKDVDDALRRGQVAAAACVAGAAVEQEPDEVEDWPDDSTEDLPRVGAVTNLQTQGSFKDVFVYGRSFSNGLPTAIEPAEVDAGAVVSGQFGHPALKNPTYAHQNHPVLEALRARHGDDLRFAGLVICPEPVESSQKELVSAHAARLCAALGWDAAIVTKEGGGNADGDMALKIDALADRGIAAVGIYAEMAGTDGTGPPVVVPPSKAAAMVSVGNYDERVTLPAVDKALGGERIALLDVSATEEVELPCAVIYGSLNPLGWGRLTAQPAEETPGVAEEKRPDREGTVRVVHYINQFFAGKGGEDSAGNAPESQPGTAGPGRKLANLLGDGFEVVATVSCGDDYAAGEKDAIDEVMALVREAEPDLLVAGPAFTSGRYGLACARLVAAATAEGIPAVASLHEDNPGLDEAGAAPVVAAGEAARTMGPTLERLAGAVRKVAAGDPLTADDGRVGKVPRRNVVAERNAAERAVDLVLARLGGDTEATEIPLPRFDRVNPAGPVEDLSTVVLALVTEGALVPDGNPDNLESARATRWLRYPLDDRETLPADEFQSVHGGFSTQWANADPHRILPLDVARELEAEGRVAGLHPAYLVTAGNGTSVANAHRFGVEWAADLRHSGAR
ncbi:MAG: glycine/betaine/sarcosine/D-proline family reductase selenoprotein B, partial [Acidimicrobiales bacterium]